ncbi:MAG: RNA 2',3'-cyclic phosphodiesterase [Candidatus Omnitrophica bacterium]|nr:RNA 2',3'-cyclic phosphodiesterase [Candidatus Omnitrophota bacterium]
MSEQGKIRTFVALELAPEMKSELCGLIRSLKSSGAQVKWARSGNLHLTLKFLGDVDESSVPLISEALSRVSGEVPFFRISFSGIGVFPSWSRPRVIWAGVSRGKKEVEALAAAVSSALESLGFEREKRAFRAHLTLGRVRGGRNTGKLREAAEKAVIPAAVLPVKKVTLFRSELDPGGAMHSVLREFPLRPSEKK